MRANISADVVGEELFWTAHKSRPDVPRTKKVYRTPDDVVQQIRSRWQTGERLRDIASALKVSVTTVCGYTRDMPARKRGNSPRTEPDDREIDMRLRFVGGASLEEIGAVHNVTRERVRQILKKRFGMTARKGDGGALPARHAAAVENKKAYISAREKACQRRHGCSLAERATIPRRATDKFRSHRNNYVRHERGGWNLTMWQWWNLWNGSGHNWADSSRANGWTIAAADGSKPISVENHRFIRSGLLISEAALKRPWRANGLIPSALVPVLKIISASKTVHASWIAAQLGVKPATIAGNYSFHLIKAGLIERAGMKRYKATQKGRDFLAESNA